MSLSSGRKSESDPPHSRPELGVYSISVVVELTGLGAGTLRGFERAGLLVPARTGGGTRRYSNDDLARLVRIRRLADEGVNLAGIARILAIQEQRRELAELVSALRAENADLRAESAALRAENSTLRAALGESDSHGHGRVR